MTTDKNSSYFFVLSIYTFFCILTKGKKAYKKKIDGVVTPKVTKVTVFAFF